MLHQPTAAFAPLTTPHDRDRPLPSGELTVAFEELERRVVAACAANFSHETSQAMRDAYDRVLALPIRSAADRTAKGKFGAQYCRGSERAEVLAELAAFDANNESDAEAEEPAAFDAAEYAAAMHAAGALVQPVWDRRGAPSHFTITLPPNPAERDRVTTIEAEFAARRAADPNADERVARVIADDAARKRFTEKVGPDLAKAVLEINRLHAVAHAADDADYPPAETDYLVAIDCVLELSVRQEKDIYLKAEFAVRHCSWSDQLQRVLTEIIAFGSPEVATALEPASLFG